MPTEEQLSLDLSIDDGARAVVIAEGIEVRFAGLALATRSPVYDCWDILNMARVRNFRFGYAKSQNSNQWYTVDFEGEVCHRSLEELKKNLQLSNHCDESDSQGSGRRWALGSCRKNT